MPRFMIGGQQFVFFGHDHGMPLCAHQDFVLGFFKVGHADFQLVGAGGKQRCFIDNIGKIGA